MAGIQRIGELELDQDLEFQRRTWIVERIAWSIMALVALAALLGLFGSGPLSSTTAGDHEGLLWLEYDRFARFQAPAVLKIHLGAGSGFQGSARVWLSREYLEGVQIENVTPEPDKVEATSDRLIYLFRIAEPDQPALVRFHLKPEQIGARQGRMGLNERLTVSFRQFIYP